MKDTDYIDPNATDKMEIETWPVVQAYALGGMGNEGFFTMNRHIYDLTSVVDAVVTDFDAFNSEQGILYPCIYHANVKSNMNIC